MASFYYDKDYLSSQGLLPVLLLLRSQSFHCLLNSMSQQLLNTGFINDEQ